MSEIAGRSHPLFQSELFDRGLEVRREVLGAEYVDRSIEGTDDFMAVFQQLTTEWCWGYLWTREGLDRRTRSLLNLAMLAASNRSAELALHVRGALNNGVTPADMQEVFVQATIYCGIPAGLEAFKVAHKILLEEGVLGDADTEVAP